MSEAEAWACCDSLSNLYLCHILNTAGGGAHTSSGVVIRFQICIFDILNTAEMVHKVYWE